jgi:hypothetical protein
MARHAAVLVGIAACTAVLVVGGNHARPAAFAEHAGAPVRTPVPRDTVDISRVRFVAIGSTQEFATALTQEDANQIANDLVDDLEIAAQAVQRRDVDLAATGADEQWLDGLRRTIERTAPSAHVDVPSYSFDAMTVAVLKLRATQAAPEIDVRVSGTRRASPDAPEQPFRRVYVMEKRGDHYVITDDRAR